MPSGATHERIQIAVTPILTVSATALAVSQGADMPQAAYMVGGAFLGGVLAIIFTPDLIDVDGDPLPETRIRKVPALGWLVAGVYDVISKMIPHRGVSHTPVIGTFITVPWLVPLLFVSPQLVGWTLAWKCVADLFHTIPDPIVTKIRKASR